MVEPVAENPEARPERRIAQNRMEDSPKPSAPVTGTRRVFLAADHSLVQEGLATLVKNAGDFKVVGQCGNWLEAVQHATETHPDVVVLDGSMPGLKGLDVCRELKCRLPDVIVLMLGMHDDREFIIRAFEYGASGYLLKESAGTELVEALKTVMAGTIYLGPGIDKSVLTRLHKPRKDTYLTARTVTLVAIPARVSFAASVTGTPPSVGALYE